MKRIFNLFVAGVFATAILGTQSCTKTCDAGYEGSDCKTEVRAKIIGTYKVVENCSSTGAANYNVSITKSGTDVQVVLVNPMGGYTGITGTGTVEGTSLTFATQTQSGYTFSAGTGTISADGGTISMSYTVAAGGQTETCTGTWTKQ